MQSKRHGALAGAAAVAVVLCVGVAVRSETQPAARSSKTGATDAQSRLRQETMTQFALRDTTVQSLVVDLRPGVSQSVAVSIEGQPMTLALQPFSVRAPGYRVLEQVADGSLVEVAPSLERTVRGTVVGIEGSVVAGAILDDGLYATINLPDERRYWIEPLVSRVAGAGGADHAVYRGEDISCNAGSCGQRDIQNGGRMLLPPVGSGGACNSSLCLADYAADADVEFYEFWGSVTAVENRINLIVNAVNVEYERDVQIRHIITTIIVRTAEPDPYSSSNNNTILSQFRNHWLANHQDIVHDIAELFTGRDIDGSVIGTASTIGGICTNLRYCFAQRIGGSFGCTTDLSAHEMGHLWNGLHCGCSSPPYTMNTPLICANQFSPSINIPRITSHRESRSCLSPLSVCGDGVVEGFEECDPPNEPVCAPDCTLYVPAVCVDSTGNCCEGNGVPGCSSPTCCDAVCDVDSFCCNTLWDPFCADIAAGRPECDCGFVPECAVDAECDNGDRCDGSESCSPVGLCEPGVPAVDCNSNGFEDSCDIAAETSGDCNGNGAPDECDIAGGESDDANSDGIPDECGQTLCKTASECDDGNVCTFERCVDGACQNEETAHGDVAGLGGICGPDGTVNIADILAVLDAFQADFPDGCQTVNMDIAASGGACKPDGAINTFDIFAVLDAFSTGTQCCP